MARPRMVWRSRRAITGPNFSTQQPDRIVGDVKATLGEEFLEISAMARAYRWSRFRATGYPDNSR